MRSHTPFRLLLLALLGLLVPQCTANLPYNPTRVFLSPNKTQHLLYVLEEPGTPGSQIQLSSIYFDSRIDSSTPSSKILYDSIPISLGDNGAVAYNAVMSTDGSIVVHSGHCKLEAGGSQLWRFIPKEGEEQGNGTWVQATITEDAYQDLGAANFLAASISFSPIVDDEFGMSIYVFGGMCPYADASEQEWQSSANYSNSLLTFEPVSSTAEIPGYGLTLSTSRGAPIPEAGFSITPLEPTYSNGTDSVRNQQQDFVLLGGHTQQAFINMSQVAIFSLPQEAWTFIPIAQISDEHTDLTVRSDLTEIEPRSGHTAVLGPDRKSIILFGGWVGDTSTAAQPQLAILDISAGYPGRGQWKWTVPVTSGESVPSGSGIYGHDTVILPGGVMMVVGGYKIPSSTASKSKRSTQDRNTGFMFYNITSNAWIPEYDFPVNDAYDQLMTQSGPLSTTSQKAGLGVGIGVGLAVIGVILIFWFWHRRRLKKRHEARDNHIRNLSMGTHYTGSSLRVLEGITRRLSSVDHNHDAEVGSAQGLKSPQPVGSAWRGNSEAERTGLLVDVPSPTRGLRRSLGGRGQYHLAPRNDDPRGPVIHPIEECDEDDEVQNTAVSGKAPEMSETGNRASVVSDPFRDPDSPPHNSQFMIPRRPLKLSRTPALPVQVQNVPADVSKNAFCIDPVTGRVSPTKSDRTESTLSDRSVRSNISANSGRSGASSAAIDVARTVSIRTINARDNLSYPTSYSAGSSNSAHSPTGHRSSTRPNTGYSLGADSFTTAKTSFLQLQQEGEALLGGPPGRRPTPLEPPDDRHRDPSPGSAAVSPTRERRLSWMGTVRRAISRATSSAGNTDRANSMASTVLLPAHPRTSGESSPIKSPTRGHVPRRSASDAACFKARRGSSAWDERNVWRRNSGDDWGSPEDEVRELELRREIEDEGEWDVEAAVGGREVQIMFSVPKQRLRVVNADVDGRSVVSTDDREEEMGKGVDGDEGGDGKHEEKDGEM
ncbi:hypothetical protein M501DRAFT_1001652 [Patellaria atrata CBS 101060]|uniref:Galactose oxidase n=1 Tax=Patellaria atrata CBS 101060 TaxID=1346257 RepID=A0A9P4SF29_9PEZI|nr:hypothetical protein M501DRAFT_1001652 [Patellaria atrata CBS 101060]